MSGSLARLTKRDIPDFLTKDQDTAQFMQGIIDQIVSGGGASFGGHFTDLSDTFPAYAGLGGYTIKVKADASGLEAVASSAASIFVTADQNLTASTALAGIPHGLTLSTAPNVRAYLVNVTPELGYAAGELIQVPTNVCDFWNTGTSTHFSLGCTISLDPTNVYITYGSVTNVFSVENRATGAYAFITAGDWKLRVAVEP